MLGLAAILIIAGILLLVASKVASKMEVPSFKIPQTKNYKVEVKMSANAPLEDQLQALNPGNIVEIDAIMHGPKDKHKVIATGEFEALNFNAQAKTFSPKGESYKVVFFDNSWVLVRFRDRWGLFTTPIVLIGEEADVFSASGAEFGKNGQRPGSVKFTWQHESLSMELLFQDEGYLAFHSKSGASPIPDGMMIKFFVATNEKSELVFLENRKLGQDKVWVGTDMGNDPSLFVSEIFR